MAGWGTSPSPPISLDVSTITCIAFARSEGHILRVALCRRWKMSCTDEVVDGAHHTLLQIIGEDAGHLPDDGGLPNARASKEKHRVGNCKKPHYLSAANPTSQMKAERSVPLQSCSASPLRMSRIMSTWPVTARPTRQVRPTIVPFRFRIALILCKVPCTPALLSLPKSPTASSAALRSSQVICTKGTIALNFWHDGQMNDDYLLQFTSMSALT